MNRQATGGHGRVQLPENVCIFWQHMAEYCPAGWHIMAVNGWHIPAFSMPMVRSLKICGICGISTSD